ncbi:MAG TPA: sugar phosphate isomerase/epimerase [Pseudonocardia sp.]|nr:sugar phosphate isomerase/epimerase [Pseudonocardia sp.]
MFRYTAEVLPYHDYPLDTALAELAGLGFSEVNLWSSAPPLAAHVNPGDDVAAVNAALARHGLRGCGLTTYGMNADEVRDRLRLAHDLEIDTVVFDCEAHYLDFVGKFLPPLLDEAQRLGVRIAVENHLTVPFSADFESGIGEQQRWDSGVDTLAQIKRLVTELDHPNLGICLAPPHLWVMGESITEAITFLAERKKLFYYYLWDIDRTYRRGEDGLDFGPGERQLPRVDGVLDHAVPLKALDQVGYTGPASLKCHGTGGWSLQRVTGELRRADAYVRSCIDRIR